jgi:hypothetical protein
LNSAKAKIKTFKNGSLNTNIYYCWAIIKVIPEKAIKSMLSQEEHKWLLLIRRDYNAGFW